MINNDKNRNSEINNTAIKGKGCNGVVTLSKNIAKELENRGIVDCEMFLDNVDIK